MLGRQAWRLISELSSLCARVLKGRYFPHADFLSVAKPRSSSFTWRSILFGRGLLVRGIIWGIGNGERISITKDSWILGTAAGNFKPLSPIPDNARVRFLMSDDGIEWVEDTVRAFFHEDLENTILQLPINKHGGEDFVSWTHDKHGCYTVKSTYNMAKTDEFFSNQSNVGRGSGSDREAEAKMWKAVWAIQAPSKMKIVRWCMIHNCLPTSHQLSHRRIPADDRCFFYNKLERVEHLFLMCPFVKAFWSEVKEHFRLKLCRKELVNMKQWIFEFLK
jgi:hypothetical protein